MREEVISSPGVMDLTPAVSSAGGSSPTVNIGRPEPSSCARRSEAISVTNMSPVQRWVSLSSSAALVSSTPCRPWEREDLLRRLSTFRPSNWGGKAKIASSLSCAQRGWINADIDKIICESCGSVLTFMPSGTCTSAEVAEDFAVQLDLGHKVSCPWRGNSCPESLVQFPLTHSSLVGGFKDRCDGLLQFLSLPVISPSATELMSLSHGVQLQRFLLSPPSGFNMKPQDPNNEDDSTCLYSRSQKLISLCGWEARWVSNVQDFEEHSAQSERDGGSLGRTSDGKGKKKVTGFEVAYESRSPVLDCGLCGATVRIWDFITVSSRVPSANDDVPETSKKTSAVHGVSAGSGINGWADHDDVTDNHATTSVDLNLAVGSGSWRRAKPPAPRTAHDIGRDLMIGQPCGSEVGDRAASYESHGPTRRRRRKRCLEKAGSSDGRSSHFLAHPPPPPPQSHRPVDSEDHEQNQHFSKRSAADAAFYRPGPGLARFWESAARASSVIAVDTMCHGGDSESSESVENCPEEVQFGDTTNDASEVDIPECSNQAQQSGCSRRGAKLLAAAADSGSTDEGEELFNAAGVGQHHFSFGISGGSVGMCASHEAEIHGPDVSVHGAGSVVGDADPSQVQTGDSVPDPPPLSAAAAASQSVEKADSGSKVEAAESMESDRSPTPHRHRLYLPSSSCNAVLCSGDVGIRKMSTKKAPPEFDPIGHHNQFCPWVNGNVTAAALFACDAALASCGWQLTLDAFDHAPTLPVLASESAASLHKVDDWKCGGPGDAQRCHSTSGSRDRQ